MSKYIKVFDTVEEYNAYSGGTAFTSPNISYIKSTDETKYDDNEIKHYTKDSWLYVGDDFDNRKTPYAKNQFKPTDGVKRVEIPSKNSLGNTITELANSCFQNYYSLESVIIPNTITSFGRFAFYNVPKLTSIDIPSGITSIGDSCFASCTGLTSIELPSGIRYINESAFYGCSNLTSVIINAVTPPNLGYTVFSDTNNCPIYVPDESVDAYKSATNWSYHSSRIKPISEKPNN